MDFKFFFGLRAKISTLEFIKSINVWFYNLNIFSILKSEFFVLDKEIINIINSKNSFCLLELHERMALWVNNTNIYKRFITSVLGSLYF